MSLCLKSRKRTFKMVDKNFRNVRNTQNLQYLEESMEVLIAENLTYFGLIGARIICRFLTEVLFWTCTFCDDHLCVLNGISFHIQGRWNDLPPLETSNYPWLRATHEMTFQMKSHLLNSAKIRKGSLRCNTEVQSKSSNIKLCFCSFSDIDTIISHYKTSRNVLHNKNNEHQI